MANICDNELRLVAVNDKAVTVLNEIRSKIADNEEDFFKYLCPDEKLWGTSGRDIDFRDLWEYGDENEKELFLRFDTKWCPPIGAIEYFQSTMRDKGFEFSISLTYIEPGYDFIGYYIAVDKMEMSLGELYARLVKGDDEEAKMLADKMAVDLQFLAESYMCLFIMDIDDEEPCTCALCLSTAQNTPNQI